MTHDTEWRLAAGIREALTEEEHEVVRSRLASASVLRVADDGEPVTRVETRFADPGAVRGTMRLVARIVGRKTPQGNATPACRLAQKAGEHGCDVLVLKGHAAARVRLRTAAPAAAAGEFSLPIGAVRRIARAGAKATVAVEGRGRTVTVAIGSAEETVDAPWAAAPAANCRRIVDDDEPMLPTRVRVDAAELRTALRSLPKGVFGKTCRIGLGPEGVRAWARSTERTQGDPVVLDETPAHGPEAGGVFDRKLVEQGLEIVGGRATLQSGAGRSDTLTIRSDNGERNVVVARGPDRE